MTEINRWRGSCAGFAAAAFLAITQVVARGDMDIWIYLSLCVFALCLPVLAVCAVKAPSAEVRNFAAWNPVTKAAILGILVLQALTILGFALFVFHFGRGPGGLFILASAPALILLSPLSPAQIAATIAALPAAIHQILRRD